MIEIKISKAQFDALRGVWHDETVPILQALSYTPARRGIRAKYIAKFAPELIPISTKGSYTGST